MEEIFYFLVKNHNPFTLCTTSFLNIYWENLTGHSALNSMGSVRNHFSDSFNFCQFKFKILDLIEKTKYFIAIF